MAVWRETVLMFVSMVYQDLSKLKPKKDV